MTIKRLIRIIQSVLTPDLLQKKYREKNKDNPLYGHCYVSSESLYHLIRIYKLPSKYKQYKPHYGKDINGINHWWLQYEDNILDVTKGQYDKLHITPPYNNGCGVGFLTKKPSKRAKIVIRRVRYRINKASRFDV